MTGYDISRAVGNEILRYLLIALLVGLVAGISLWELAQFLWAHVSLSWT